MSEESSKPDKDGVASTPPETKLDGDSDVPKEAVSAQKDDDDGQHPKSLEEEDTLEHLTPPPPQTLTDLSNQCNNIPSKKDTPKEITEPDDGSQLTEVAQVTTTHETKTPEEHAEQKHTETVTQNDTTIDNATSHPRDTLNSVETASTQDYNRTLESNADEDSKPLGEKRKETTKAKENSQLKEEKESNDSSSSSEEDDDEEEDSDSDDDDDENNGNHLSQYELLRLRNIERNNARLAQLGLNKITPPKKPTPTPKKHTPVPEKNGVVVNGGAAVHTPARIMPRRSTKATLFFGEYLTERKKRSGVNFGDGGNKNCCFICYGENVEDGNELLSCDYCRKKFHKKCHTIPLPENPAESRIKCMVCAGARRQRKGRCGVCEGCTRENCGACIYCLDMPRFGGQARLRKSCEMRTCTKPVYALASMEKIGGTGSMCTFVDSGGGGGDGDMNETSSPLDGTKVKLSDKLDEGERSHQNTDNCVVCDDGGCLICCDGCDRAYHMLCHTPRLYTLPSGEWKCMECAPPTDANSDHPTPKRKRRNKRIIAKIGRKIIGCRVNFPIAFCSVCFEDADEGNASGDFVYCRYCDESFHLKCLSPPLESKPRGTYKCDKCKEAHQNTPRRPAVSRRPCVKLEPKADTTKNDDNCYVCINGGELLCCDFCEKSFHLECHIPPIVDIPGGKWKCMECKAVQRRKRSRCGECKACLAPDCGKCMFCLDKPKFGGKYTLKKPCKMRECTNLNYADMIPVSIVNRKSKVTKKKGKGTQKSPKSQKSIVKKANENGFDGIADKSESEKTDKSMADDYTNSCSAEKRDTGDINKSPTLSDAPTAKKECDNEIKDKPSSETNNVLPDIPSSSASTTEGKSDNPQSEKKDGDSGETKEKPLLPPSSSPSITNGTRKRGRPRRSQTTDDTLQKGKETNSADAKSPTPALGKKKPGRPRKSQPSDGGPPQSAAKKRKYLERKEQSCDVSSPASATERKRKPGRPRKSLPPVDSNSAETKEQTLTPPLTENGKRKRGRPRKSPCPVKEGVKISTSTESKEDASPNTPVTFTNRKGKRKPGRPRKTLSSGENPQVKIESDESLEGNDGAVPMGCQPEKTPSSPLPSPDPPTTPSKRRRGRPPKRKLSPTPPDEPKDEALEKNTQLINGDDQNCEESARKKVKLPLTPGDDLTTKKIKKIINEAYAKFWIPKVQDKACEHLRKMITDVEVGSKVIELGGLKMAIKAMESFPDKTIVQAEACALLAQIVWIDPANASKLDSEGAIDMVVSAMKRLAFNSKVQQMGCGTFRSLTYENNNSEYIEKVNGTDVVLLSMTNNPQKAMVQKEGCFFLQNMLIISEETASKVANAEIIPIVARTMANHPLDIDIQDAICGFFSNLASLDGSTHQSIADAGVIPFLIAALRDCDHPDVKHSSCSALRQMASSKECAEIIADNGGILWIINAMKSYPKDPILLASACGVLKGLTLLDDRHGRTISRDGGVELVISAMGNHSSSAELQEVACAFLALDSVHCGKKTVTEATRKVLSAMENHRGEVYVQFEACRALLKLSQAPSVLETLNEVCACKQLSLLKGSFPEACGALIDKLQERIGSLL